MSKYKKLTKPIYKLKPCPFCGGKVELHSDPDLKYAGFDAGVACYDCHVYMRYVFDFHYDKDKAFKLVVDKWNSRAAAIN